ncbi:hypothetical protein [Roseixanthobacter pseudopolyaromaticivorans]|uniref:hypothetical protein n=1 Tax=Xanthobacteraceae TaxID=335928 RepID=UPI0037295810
MKADANLLEELHGVVVRELMSRIKSGEATSGDIAAAVRMLKDNGVDARSKDAVEMEDRLSALLPFQAAPSDPDIID